MTVENRKIKEKENRKSAILKAARSLFFAKGFNAVTVESIARKAEISKGSIYLHFQSKEEIYSNILLSQIDKFRKHIDLICGNGGEASELLLKIADAYVDFFIKDAELFRILMSFMLSTSNGAMADEIRNHIIRTTNKSIDIIEQIIRRGIETKEFSGNINTRQTRNAIWGLFNGVIALHLFSGQEKRREELIRSTIRESLKIFIMGMKEKK